MLDAVEWGFDQAASGNRLRAWIRSNTGEPAELVAYEDGRWALSFPRRQYPYVATGYATTQEDAKERVFRVWESMR